MLDTKDDEILEYLMLHPGASVKEVAGKLRIPRPTAQRRIFNLRLAKHLKEVLAVNPNSLGYSVRYRIDVVVNTPNMNQIPMTMKELAQHIKNMAQESRFKDRLIVENVYILLGASADLSLRVRAKAQSAVLDFVSEGLRTLRAVQQTSTSQEAWALVEEFLI